MWTSPALRAPGTLQGRGWKWIPKAQPWQWGVASCSWLTQQHCRCLGHSATHPPQPGGHSPVGITWIALAAGYWHGRMGHKVQTTTQQIQQLIHSWYERVMTSRKIHMVDKPLLESHLKKHEARGNNYVSWWNQEVTWVFQLYVNAPSCWAGWREGHGYLGGAISHRSCQDTYLIRHQRGNGSADLMIGLGFALWSQQNEEKSDKTKRLFPFRMAKRTA